MTASRGLPNVARWLAGLFLLTALGLPAPAGRADDFDVDLALVLAIDCSFSVDAHEFQLQMQGMAQAFMRPEVKKAIASGHRRRIAVAVIEWSDAGNEKTVVPWTIIGGAADADEFGRIVMSTGRDLAQGGTSVSTALIYASALFSSAPSAERRTIDISSDGRNNSGPPVSPVRDRVVAQGITINALTILNEWPTLDIYYDRNVAGGPDYFVMPADDYQAYGDAIYRKLLREITSPGIS